MAVCCRYSMDPGYAESGEFHRGYVRVLSFRFVDRKQGLDAGFPEVPGEVFVAHINPGTAVDQEDHCIASSGDAERLFRNELAQRILGGMVDSTGINDNVTSRSEPADSDFGVTGESRYISDKCVAGVGQPIE